MKVALILSCSNHEATLPKVIEDCRRHFPQSEILVVDNGSKDASVLRARKAGVKVVSSSGQGQGPAIRQALRDLRADYVVYLETNGTYPIHEAPRLIDFAQRRGLDMVTGSRLELGLRSSFRRFHYVGNQVFSSFVRRLLHYPVQDPLSGFRILSARFVREVSLKTHGPEVKAEMTLRAMNQNIPCGEIAIPYAEATPHGMPMQNAFQEGWTTLTTAVDLWREMRRTRSHGAHSSKKAA